MLSFLSTLICPNQIFFRKLNQLNYENVVGMYSKQCKKITHNVYQTKSNLVIT